MMPIILFYPSTRLILPSSSSSHRSARKKSIRSPSNQSSLQISRKKDLIFQHTHLQKSPQRTMATVGGISNVQDNENSLEIDALARFAVDEHNKKENSLLQFGKVVNAKQQVVSGTVYYLTIEATDGGAKKVYEAKIWVKPWMDFKEVQEFKLICDA